MSRRRRARTASVAEDGALGPTPEYAQHHDVDTRPARAGGVAGHRVLTRLDGLLARGQIGAAEWQAGDLYRRDFEVGEQGASPAQMGDGGGGHGCPTAARLDALRRLATARAVLGKLGRPVADAIACDASWSALGAALGVSREVAQVRAAVVLGMLAGHYRLYGAGRGRAV